MIIYKTTNLVNGKIYIGKSTKNDPNYLGSGRILLKAIAKYGKEKFTKEIIDTAKTFEELNEKEKFWIKKMNSQNHTIGYNILSGGEGVSSKDVTGEKNPNYGNGWKIAGERNCQFGLTGEKSPNWGRKHSEETKEKMRKSAKEYHKGTRTDDERRAIKEGMAKNRNYFIEQYDKESGELINTYVSILEAKIAVGTTYYRVATNNHPLYKFIKVLKDE
ncbi:MAG TPA: GIY-YIG nuclease family protein [Bacteroidales bacterium]|nr:GIY-YIG nuclease family protein [Bacteroidales bacterium]